MKNSYYKKLFDNWIKRLKFLKDRYDPRIKWVWLSKRKFKAREEKLQTWIVKMYEFNNKYNKENK